MASRRFNFLERRLEKDQSLKLEYDKFIAEYESLNHLSISESSNKERRGFYMPHHAIKKDDSLTTKVRVVFDASAKSSSGISLNDTLRAGPTIQDNLFSILTRFRTHKIALMADIEKMYRQILVNPQDSIYQKILFRSNSNDLVNEYILNTVTYGTKCAPFLAIRTLHKLADDEAIKHPIASEILKRDFYVDDLLTGSKTIEDARFIIAELIQLLKRGGFNLRKWASNDPTLFTDNPMQSDITHMSLDPDSSIKTLGLYWNCREDYFFFLVNISAIIEKITKRSILSMVSKLYDPLGLLGPIILIAKLIIQHLWKSGISWDESIPLEAHTTWTEYQTQLPILRNLQFPRFDLISDFREVQLHGFSDASKRAYGACIYFRSTNSGGKINVSSVCSKSKVAPIKPVTLPRLELCAAVLLARLMITVKNAVKIDLSSTVLWSDSSITLSWINTEPKKLKTFVRNRVAEIQELSVNCDWRHVPTLDNPADLVSRGQMPNDFVNSELWKNGPTWLMNGNSQWPPRITKIIEITEKRNPTNFEVALVCKLNNLSILEKYSSMKKLLNVITYVVRFINNSMNQIKRVGPILPSETAESLQIVMRLTQIQVFAKEINCLKNEKLLDKNSSLLSLNPFLDKNNILRVGGRLVNSDLPVEQKHPIILPSNHNITNVIIREKHLRLKHAGTQATLYSVRELYWPINGRNVTRKIIHQCIPCFRAKPRGVDYLMGNLPQERVTFSRPFLEIGVDYCGPLYIKEKRFRNKNKIKVYIAFYVCMSTKAVHLEVVSDLTTEAFLASLKQLFSRLGKAQTIYSDNATNFVGANRELNEIYDLLLLYEQNDKFVEYLNEEKIFWKFIPPRSSHFGGLWDAAVKAFKRFLVRTVGDTLLTFAQLETFVIEVEAILNSRPISPLSTDPNDVHPLTPGHFLIGSPLTSFPQVDFSNVPANRLSLWQHAHKMRAHFWKRWHHEYLHQLITRTKWTSKTENNIKIGTLVIIKDDNAPLLQWTTGRITSLSAGSDGVDRVAVVRTNKGEYKRSLRNLCPLPIIVNKD